MSKSEVRDDEARLRAICIDDPITRIAKVDEIASLYSTGVYLQRFASALSAAVFFTMKDILFEGEIEGWRRAGHVKDWTRIQDLACYLGGYVGWIVLLMLQESASTLTAERKRSQEIGRTILAELVGQMYYSGSNLASSELVRLRQRVRTTRLARSHPYDGSTPLGQAANLTVDAFKTLHEIYPQLSLLTRIKRRLPIFNIRLADRVIDEPVFWIDEVLLVNNILGVTASKDPSIALHLASLIGNASKAAHDGSLVEQG